MRHIYWTEVAGDLINGSWGEQKESSKKFIEGAMDSRLTVCLLIDIAKSLREQRDSLNAVRHFVHGLGEKRLRLILKEKHRELDLRAKRRRSARRKRSEELAAKRARATLRSRP